MRKSILAATAAMMLATPAMAQNIGNNAGIWWQPVAGQPSAFTFLNPLTTIYGRIGFFHASRGDVTTHIPFVAPPTDYNTSMSNGFGAVLGVGARLMPVLRYELQASGDFTHDTVYFVFGADLRARHSSAQIMNNFYFDLAPLFGGALGGFNPYAMAGVGVSFNRSGEVARFTSLRFLGSDSTRADFAWNVGAGVQYQVMRNLILDLGYRYLDHGRFRTNAATIAGGGFFWNATTTTRATAHQIMFSIVVPVDGLIRGFGN